MGIYMSEQWLRDCLGFPRMSERRTLILIVFSMPGNRLEVSCRKKESRNNKNIIFGWENFNLILFAFLFNLPRWRTKEWAFSIRIIALLHRNGIFKWNPRFFGIILVSLPVKWPISHSRYLGIETFADIYHLAIDSPTNIQCRAEHSHPLKPRPSPNEFAFLNHWSRK